MAKISKIESKSRELPKRKRVAAYARVSLNSERLHHSLSAQVSYYSDLIQKNPEWEFAGVYADEGISGTGTKNRTEFRRMLSDCEAGKIDIVLTKSISRFARNTVDLLKAVRHLKELGIEVRFEKEHIRSLSSDGEVMLTLLASFAQEEVRSLSSNVRWSRKKKIDKGEAPIHMQVTGYRWDGNELIIEPEEAKIIRRIFQEYLDGHSPGQICKGLKSDGIKTIRGHAFQEGPVYKILRNVIYKGDLLLQKTYIDDPISKVQKFNTGELPQVYVKEDHLAIIPPELFDTVQEEMKRRKESWLEHENNFEGMYFFTWKVRCEETGRAFQHANSKSEEPYGMWRCIRTGCPYRDNCRIGAVPELAIRQACTRALNLDVYDEDLVAGALKEVSVPDDGKIVVRLNDGTTYSDYFRSFYESVKKQPRNKNVFSKKLVCGLCGHYFSTQSGYRPTGIRRVTWYCKDTGDNTSIHENVLKYRIAEAAGWDAFSLDRFQEEIDKIIMDKPYQLTIQFKNGRKKSVQYYSQTIRRSKR